MIKSIREEFNQKFNISVYSNFLNDINKLIGRELDFRVCETPLFLDENTKEKLIEASYEIINEISLLIENKQLRNNIPKKYLVPNETKHPLFLQIDFALTKDDDNSFTPKLIELQGFPSLYNFQAYLEQNLRKHFWIPENFTSYFNGLNYSDYLHLLKETIVGEHDPANVILLEIDPLHQKTWIDFHLAEMNFGIKPVCVSDIIQRGNKLFYKSGNKKIKIERIYNRVIFDELERSEIFPSFNFYDDLDVEWAGHPSWFFKVSKNILPLIKSKYSPKSFYLNDINNYPENLEAYVLKPLYSFAGSGVMIDIDKNILDKIKHKENYILQKKVEYAPVIKTPEGYSKTEIRMMFLWNKEPVLVNNLLRVSKGKMIGVDYNKNKTWVGANIAFHS